MRHLTTNHLKLATLLGALAAPLALARPAAAADGCVLNDNPGNAGASIGALLPDDLTAFTPGDSSFGKTGFAAATAIGLSGSLPARAESAFINAGLSDITMQIFVPQTNVVADSTLGYGGDGTNFQGGVFAFYCPKGQSCSLDLPASRANKNQAWECNRQFITGTPIRASLDTSGTLNGATGGPLASFQDTWEKQLTRQIRNDKGIDAVHGPSSTVSIEPFGSYCRRTGTNCGTTTNQGMWDVIRLHWEGQVDPKVTGSSNGWCAVETGIECGLSLGFYCPFSFADKAPICDAAVGVHHVVIDTWLRPAIQDPATMDLATTPNTGTPMRFIRGATRVSVEAGTGDTAMQSKILQAVTDTDVAGLTTLGIFDGIGDGLCHPSVVAGFSGACSKSNATAGAQLLGFDRNPSTTTWPQRVQLDYYVDLGEPASGFFSAKGSVVGTNVELFTMNFGTSRN